MKVTVEYIAQPFDTETVVVDPDTQIADFVTRTNMEPHSETHVIEGQELEILMDHLSSGSGMPKITKPSELINNPAFTSMEDVLSYHLEFYLHGAGEDKVTITNYTVED